MTSSEKPPLLQDPAGPLPRVEGGWPKGILFSTLGVAAAIAVALFLVSKLTHTDGSTTQSGPAASSVASLIGADYCDKSGFYVESKLNGSKSTIYDCMTGAKARCVTVDGGLPNDSTLVVRLLFANVLGGEKPTCLSGYASSG